MSVDRDDEGDRNVPASATSDGMFVSKFDTAGAEMGEKARQLPVGRKQIAASIFPEEGLNRSSVAPARGRLIGQERRNARAARKRQ
jgi:hypothetical protein